MTENRWLAQTGGTRGEGYAARFAQLAAAGMHIHGEADLVASLVPPGSRVLDAGCGTGRVAIELERRGYDVVGVDVDPSMLAVARREAPHLRWVEADLAELSTTTDEAYDLVVLAGNVLVYVAPGTQPAVIHACANRLAPDAPLVAGFQLSTGHYDLARLDADADAAGIELVHRWATWDREPYAGGDYAVSVFRR